MKREGFYKCGCVLIDLKHPSRACSIHNQPLDYATIDFTTVENVFDDGFLEFRQTPSIASERDMRIYRASVERARMKYESGTSRVPAVVC